MARAAKTVTQSQRLREAAQTHVHQSATADGDETSATAAPRAKTDPRAIRFPKAIGALRQHVADIRIEPQPTSRVRLKISPQPVLTIGGRPTGGPSRGLRDQVAGVRGQAASGTPATIETTPIRVGQAPAGAGLDRPEDFGRLIRESRRRHGMNQTALAEAAGTGRRFISDLEAGKATAELGLVLAVCRALGLRLQAVAGHA